MVSEITMIKRLFVWLMAKKLLSWVAFLAVLFGVTGINYFIFHEIEVTKIKDEIIMAYLIICSTFFMFTILKEIKDEIIYRINIPSEKQMREIMNDLIEQEKERLVDEYRRARSGHQ